MRIGEVADAAGTSAKTLRFYEAQGLLPEVGRTPTGYRDYPREVVSRVDFVHRGKAAGLTLAQIKQILDVRDRDQAPCEHVRSLLDTKLADLDQQIRQLNDLRETVAELRDRAATPDPDTCHADQVCRYL
ncbi:heavy metal-responsive transcriptional regulator [Promicromonospora soli]